MWLEKCVRNLIYRPTHVRAWKRMIYEDFITHLNAWKTHHPPCHRRWGTIIDAIQQHHPRIQLTAFIITTTHTSFSIAEIWIFKFLDHLIVWRLFNYTWNLSQVKDSCENLHLENVPDGHLDSERKNKWELTLPFTCCPIWKFKYPNPQTCIQMV